MHISTALARATRFAALCLVASLVSPASAHSQEDTAWDRILLERPDAAEAMTDLEREILQRLAPEDLQRFLEAPRPGDFRLLSGEGVRAFLARLGLPPFAVPWHSIDCGGGLRSSGASFQVSGVSGQTDTRDMTGGAFEIAGGFWSITLPSCDVPNAVFCDGFESGDTLIWSGATGD